MSGMFKRVAEQQAGKWVSLRTIDCTACGFTGRFSDATRSGMPSELVERKFRQMGWDSPKPGGGTCPACVAKPKPERIEVTPEPPKQPSNQDRRRIRDALDEHYIEDKGCYRQSFTDKSLAAKLNVPAKWVSDMRELNGYGPDANEEASAYAAEAAAIRKDLSAIETDVLKRLDDIGSRLRKMEVKSAYAA